MVALAGRRVECGAGSRQPSVATVAVMDQACPSSRAREATIPTAKLVSYALDPSHKRGGTKRGCSPQRWASHRATGGISTTRSSRSSPEAKVGSTHITPFGIVYEVIVMIDGLNGRTAAVVTTWIVANDATPRLTSAWVDIP